MTYKDMPDSTLALDWPWARFASATFYPNFVEIYSWIFE